MTRISTSLTKIITSDLGMQSTFNLEEEVEDDGSKSIVDHIEDVSWIIFYDNMSQLHFYSNLTTK
jgi:hypothetical protein